MTTKDKVKQRIDSIGDEYMDELDKLIEDFVQSKSENGSSDRNFLLELSEIQFEGPEDFASNVNLYTSGKKSVMARLREIRIDAPEDFAANHDFYLNNTTEDEK
jgi:hypothetical protein